MHADCFLSSMNKITRAFLMSLIFTGLSQAENMQLRLKADRIQKEDGKSFLRTSVLGVVNSKSLSIGSVLLIGIDSSNDV